MVKFKALYKGMYDDIKDAEMMIKYACEIKETQSDKALADEIAKYALFRLNHYKEFHKLFEQEMSKESKHSEESVENCLWEETHKHIEEWYEKVKKKIDKY